MACIDKASCGKENACDNIQIGDVVTVKETRGQGDGGVGVVRRAINDDGTLRVKYTIGGGTARAVARADCRPGSHAGEHYEKKLTKWRERVDSFFAARRRRGRRRLRGARRRAAARRPRRQEEPRAGAPPARRKNI